MNGVNYKLYSPENVPEAGLLAKRFFE